MTQKMLELTREAEARAAAALEAAEAREAELHAAAPALFAEPGDVLQVQDEHDERSTFEYEGRSTDDDWLMFQISDGDDIFETLHSVIGTSSVATYAVYSDDGTPDPTRIKLPPSMCYMFRLLENDEPEESEQIYEAIRIGDNEPGISPPEITNLLMTLFLQGLLHSNRATETFPS
jgi:hypothetical protein